MAIIRLISQSVYKLNYSTSFMDFHGNLLSSLARSFPTTRWISLSFRIFARWLFLLISSLMDSIETSTTSLNPNHLSSEETQKNVDKVLLKNYDVFIRTLRLMKSHQVLMEQATTRGSKLIIIFDSDSDPHTHDMTRHSHDKFIMLFVYGELEKDTKYILQCCLFYFSFSYHMRTIYCSHTLWALLWKRRRQKIIIYYGPLST